MAHCNTFQIRRAFLCIPDFIRIGISPGSRKKVGFDRLSTTEHHHPTGSIHRLIACFLLRNIVIHLTGNRIIHICIPFCHSLFSDLAYRIGSRADRLCTECFHRCISRHLTWYNSFQIRFQIHLINDPKSLFLSCHFQDSPIGGCSLISSDRFQCQRCCRFCRFYPDSLPRLHLFRQAKFRARLLLHRKISLHTVGSRAGYPHL